MTKDRYTINVIKGLIIVVLFIVLLLTSFNSQAQTRTPGSDRTHEDRSRTARATSDSLLASQKYLLTERYDSLRGATKPLYLGIEGSLGYIFHSLKSDIPKLNKLRVSYIGGTVGGVMANQLGKLKANVGLYYSDASTPYTFDLLTGNLSTNLYLLRIGKIKYHTLEPYVIGGVSLQQIKFYGMYLNDGTQQNYSISEEELLGKTRTTQFSAGLGAEFQLESDYGDFIHLFAEVVYGIPAADRSSREVFNQTHILNPVTISIGISLGKIRNHK
jgi:hypothetical protein